MTSTPSSTSRINGKAIENAFPTPPTGDTAPDNAFRLKGRISPAPQRFLPLQRAQSTPPELTHSNQLGVLTKGSQGLSDLESLEHSWSKLGLSKKKSQYYDNAFAYREPNNTAKERVAKDSVILAEVKLNCCVEFEKEFLIDLSFRLSEIYQRPASCVMAMVTTDVQMLLGGNSEPAYHLTITALPSEIAATKNKRSTHLIQDFIQDTLQIPPKRGVLRFDAVSEENLATNGMTALQEIEQLERQSSDEDCMLRALSRQRSRRSKKSSAPAFTERFRVGLPSIRSTTPSSQRFNTAETTQTKSTDAIGLGKKRVKKRQSILGFFRK
ncbi:Macrophage migration inhibitory factor family protein [Cladophialophora carrionii]|uniref:L-dopachrome isomerase n=1 Tax=Cladophialophora carrionii TaxID=86049 RepID=A0A1C1CMK4_9EURO|nr:Macrophage migration inhibitory factor family protein [Cladophialophora carrionii]